jgi:type II secretory pathway pseudopilin PulG
MTAHGRRALGFSLVELAVSLAVLGLLLGSLVMPLAAQSEMRTRRETEKALADIHDALIGFAVANGRLPCPAVPTAVSGMAGAGIEARNDSGCLCTAGTNLASTTGSLCVGPAAIGVLPWSTLGLPEVDAWGRRFTFAIDPLFGRPPGQDTFGCAPTTAPRFAGFALCSPPHVEVATAAGGARIVSGGVPAIAVCHGKNGYGGYTAQGLRIPATGAGPDEAENANSDAVFVSSTNIDDQVTWVPTPILMHRMLSAGLLP